MAPSPALCSAKVGDWYWRADRRDLVADRSQESGHLARVQPGLDHYYRDLELDLKTLALALTVMLELGRPLPAACQPRSAAAPMAAIASAS